MGSGKTTHIISHINATHQAFLLAGFDPDRETDPGHETKASRFLVITPLLSEVDRFTKACPALDFRNPQPVEGRKLHHLATLVREGRNIVSTHSLFANLNRDIVEELKAHNYTLIIDEALDCARIFTDLTKADKRLLFDKGMVYVDKATGRLCWNTRDHGDYRGKFTQVRDLCLNGNLCCRNGEILIWEFPVEFLDAFREVFILTYLFEGSLMSAYLKANRQRYRMTGIRDGCLVDHHQIDEREIKRRIADLVTIYDGPMNAIGAPKRNENPLSASWFNRQPPKTLKTLCSSTRRFFEIHAGTPSSRNMWTCFRAQRSDLKGPGYTRGFVALNTRATNDHVERSSLAYLCNVFPHPIIEQHFASQGIAVDRDLFALSEMIQWIWRSQIRRGDPITLFIPSRRMRELIAAWLSSTKALAVSASDECKAA